MARLDSSGPVRPIGPPRQMGLLPSSGPFPIHVSLLTIDCILLHCHHRLCFPPIWLTPFPLFVLQIPSHYFSYLPLCILESSFKAAFMVHRVDGVMQLLADHGQRAAHLCRASNFNGPCARQQFECDGRSSPQRVANQWALTVHRRQRLELQSRIDDLMRCNADGHDDGLRRPDLWLGHALDLPDLGGPAHYRTPAGAADERGVAEDGGDEFAAEFLWIYPIGIGHKNRCLSMPPSDLKGTLIGDEDGEVRPARWRMLPSMPAAAVLAGLRSRRICDHVVVTNRLDSFDHPSRSSLVDGEDDVGVGSSSPNLEGVDVVIVLSGSDWEIAAVGEGRQAVVPGGGDEAPK
ncbi:hypothetical protein ACLOJK_034580 [Asimina triloba]